MVVGEARGPSLLTGRESPIGSSLRGLPAPSMGGAGFLRVVSPAQLDQHEASQLAAIAEAARPRAPEDLGYFIRRRWEAMRNHRNTGPNPIGERLLRAQRMFEGQYDPEKLRAIRL